MASTIVDVAEYGNLKGRDFYGRDIFQAVKGDGSSASSITNTYYGIPSTTDTEYVLASTTVSESAVDSEVGAYTIQVHDGTSLSDVITATSTDVTIDATAHVGTLTEDSLAEAATVAIASDGTDASITMTIGTTAPVDVMTVVPTGVDILGALTVDGTDILDTITGGNAWEINDILGVDTVQSKAAYPLVEINTLSVGGHTNDIALDVNGSIVDRGNNFYMYDEAGTTNLSTLSFNSATNSLSLRTSLADQSGSSDSITIQTTNGTDATYLPRLAFDGGLGDQNATFTNVNLGVGAVNTGAGNILEVTGESLFTGGVTTTGNIDVSGSDLLNVSDITSSDALAEQASIVLTSHATLPQLDFVLGDLDVTPTTAMTLTESAATINVETTITDNLIVSGDFTVNGTTTTVNTAEVVVEDKEIDLAYTASTHADIDGGGITLGSTTVSGLGVTLPTLLYSQANLAWESSVDVDVPTANKFTVGTNEVELASTGLDLNTDTAMIHIGSTKQWRIRMDNDGSFDHLYFEHDDLGTGVTWETKLDIMQ